MTSKRVQHNHLSSTNCDTGWAGHWRGSNATEETVICDLSFHIRWSLDAMCSRGYTVAGWPTNTYWASDLMHRGKPANSVVLTKIRV